MKIIDDSITLEELKQLAENMFGNVVKAVVDVEKEILAIDAELHSDLEAFLLQEGSRQNNLWGINLYPEMTTEEFVEFDSMINLRPSQGNKSRGIQDENIRNKVLKIIEKRVEK